ncbi:MAG: NAD-dependent epimerase/dehydratase family protein [Flavobacteriales bacterium]|nr:NAD-dependent epimerase/dehydratase family protein [Flavobacteriales bacterium]
MATSKNAFGENPVSLVTGGAGFIGSHVVDELLRLKHHVIVLDDLSGGFEANIHSAALFVKGSITDVELINALFEQHQIEYVYHLAAYAAEGLSHFIRRFNYENNLIGSINLINASVNHKVKCFVFTSSIAVYGNAVPPMSERTQPSPVDPYGIAKYAVELDLKNAQELFGLNSIIFRPHNVYGSRQNIGDKYRNVVGIFMNQLLRNEKLTVFGDGNQTRAFTHIRDVAPHIARSVEIHEAYNETFNIGSDSVFSVNTLAQLIGDVIDVQPEIEYLEEREEVDHAYANHLKFERFFNIHEHVPLQEGLEEMYEWVKRHGAKESASFNGIEIEQNLPNSWKAQQ